MKFFLKRIAPCLCAVMVCLSCFIVPVSATSDESMILYHDEGTGFACPDEFISVDNGNYILVALKPGRYEISFGEGSFPLTGVDGFLYHAVSFTPSGDITSFYSYDGESPFVLDCSDYPILEYPDTFFDGYSCVCFVNSYGAKPTITEVKETPLYESAYELFAQFIYGKTENLTADQTLTLTILATLCALFVVAVPFLVVWIAINVIGRY